ncbi:AAA family ATPase, partial [Dolichospermum sp. ST_sed10]|nr:AAA family ATPase [Dolichospermum sp. ST_sed10]
MSDLFKGFEQLVELVKALEEKAENGEIKTNVQFNSRPLSSIPTPGNIPRTSNMGGNVGSMGNDVGTSRM